MEPCDVDAMKTKLAVRYELPANSKWTHVSSWKEAHANLAEELPDVVLFGGFSDDDASVAALRETVDLAESSAVIVLSDAETADAALIAGKCGAHGFLHKSKLTGEELAKVIHATLSLDADADQPAGERRKDVRYELTKSAVVLPLDPFGAPKPDIVATTLDISEGGIAILAESDQLAVGEVAVVGVECSDGIYRYATVEWRYRRLQLPAVRLGGRFLSRVDDPLHPSQLVSRFSADKLQYAPATDAGLLKAWVSRGILRPHVVDHVLSCPDCHCLPSYRNGCPECGSAATSRAKHIHHFACAVVAPVGDFGTDPLTCPKCQAKNLVVGADFEYLEGPFCCGECVWTDTQLALIGECVACGKRYSAEDGHSKEVYEYRMERLNPRKLIDSIDG